MASEQMKGERRMEGGPRGKNEDKHLHQPPPTALLYSRSIIMSHRIEVLDENSSASLAEGLI